MRIGRVWVAVLSLPVLAVAGLIGWCVVVSPAPRVHLSPHRTKYPLVLAQKLVRRPFLIVAGYGFIDRSLPAGTTITWEQAVDIDGPVILAAPLNMSDWNALAKERQARGHLAPVELSNLPGAPACAMTPDEDFLPGVPRFGPIRPPTEPPPMLKLLPLSPAERKQASQDPFSPNRWRE